ARVPHLRRARTGPRRGPAHARGSRNPYRHPLPDPGSPATSLRRSRPSPRRLSPRGSRGGRGAPATDVRRAGGCGAARGGPRARDRDEPPRPTVSSQPAVKRPRISWLSTAVGLLLGLGLLAFVVARTDIEQSLGIVARIHVSTLLLPLLVTVVA